MENPFEHVIMMQSHTHPKLAKKIADQLDIELNPMRIYHFGGPGGCTLPKFEKSVRGKTVLVLETQTPPVNENYVIMLQIVRAASSNGAEKVYVLMPNYFYARSEKDDQSHSCDFASVVYHALKREGMSGMYSNDLHADSITSYKGGSVFVFNMSIMYKYVEAIKELALKDYVIGVADSDIKLAENLASRLNYSGPLISFPKFRKDNRKKTEYGDPVGHIEPGQDVVLIDDESLTGSTVISAARKLKEQKRVGKIYAFLARIWPDDSWVYKLNQSPIDKIFSTNSTPFEKSILREKFEILDITDLYCQGMMSFFGRKSFPKEMKFSQK